MVNETIDLGEGLSLNVGDNYDSDYSATEVSWEDRILYRYKRVKLTDQKNGATVDIKVKVYRFKNLFKKEKE